MNTAAVRDDFEPISPRGDGITQLRLPMAGNPLRYVNAYLVADVAGYTLVDCGWKANDVYDALVRALQTLGIGLRDVTTLLVTHTHFDHYGLAATLLRSGVGALRLHGADDAFARRIITDPKAADREADAWIARNGFALDDTLADDIDYHRTELAEVTAFVADGESIGRLSAIWTPGHTPGHLCFRDTRSGLVLTGDHILDPITPHVGIWMPERGDPLGEYIASLHKMRAVPAAGVLPAHGEPWPDLVRRINELLVHVDLRERRIIDVLRASGSADAATVAAAIPWTRRESPFASLSPAHRQFAVAETLAHLEHLRVNGLATYDLGATKITYALA